MQGGVTVLHADLDAFYASVEQLLDPTLRGRPLAVGGGVVLAASYEARRHGVRAGMAGWQARRMCPSIRFVGGHFSEYRRLGDAVVAVFHDFTPVVERVSIDEAFLDVSGSIRLFGPPAAIAASIRERVRTELGLPLSIGVARCRLLAKVASQVAKPDGLVVVEADAEARFLDPLPVGLIPGVGPVAESRLHLCGIRTIGQMVAAGEPAALRLLDPAAPLPRTHVRSARSMGAQAALGRRAASPQLLQETLGYLADRVAGRLRAAGLAGRTVTVRVRFTGLRSVTRALTLRRPEATTVGLTEVATQLAGRALDDHPAEREITLLGISVSGLGPDGWYQPELPMERGPTRPGVDRSVDAIRQKFGGSAIGYATVAFSGGDRVPEAFRELAEHPGVSSGRDAAGDPGRPAPGRAR